MARLSGEERRLQIAEAALELLGAGGPGALTLKAIGAAIGTSDVTVLRHYADKQAVVRAAIALFGARLDADLPHELEDPLERLGRFCVRRLHTVRRHPALLGLAYNSRLRDVAGEDAALVDATVQRSARFIRACVEEAQDQGAIRGDIPTELWLWTIAGVIRGAAQALPSGLKTEAPAGLQSPEQLWELLERLLRA